MNVHRFGSSIHNWYIVTDGGKATVIDAGCSKEYDDLVKAMASLSMTIGDIETILVTHGHQDHFGFAAEAMDNDVSVKIHEDDVARVTGTYLDENPVTPAKVPMWRPRVIRFVTVLAMKGVTRMPTVSAIETFTDGEVLDTPGKPKVIHTPGHTEGHAAFYFAEDRLMFTGDALVTIGLFKKPDGPQLLPETLNFDIDQARQSLQLLSGYATDHIYPGHGKPLAADISEVVAQMG